MAKPYNGSSDETCAMRGGKLCYKVCPTCKFQVHIRGLNPQTGAEMDVWDCSFALMPILTIENSAMQRQTGAAVDSFRNEVVERQEMGSNSLRIAQQEAIRRPLIGVTQS